MASSRVCTCTELVRASLRLRACKFACAFMFLLLQVVTYHPESPLRLHGPPPQSSALFHVCVPVQPTRWSNPPGALCARTQMHPCVAQVPPYSRAGLYKQLATLKDLLREFREDPVKNASLRPVIAATMEQAGLYEDLPYPAGDTAGKGGALTAEAAEELPVEGEVSVATVRRILSVALNDSCSMGGRRLIRIFARSLVPAVGCHCHRS